MKLIFDTDVVLDLLLDRPPHSEAAAKLFSRVESGEGIAGYLCATTLTTIYYLIAKALGARRAEVEIGKILSLFEVAPVNRAVLEGALRGHFPDYEDGVVHKAARQVGANAIVARNVRDYKNSSIPVYSPVEFVKMLGSMKEFSDE